MCDLEAKLAKLEKLYQKGDLSENEFYQLAHPLCEEHYEPLRQFLIKLLDSPNDGIRLQTTHLLNTHWPEKQDIGEKLIELLLNDPDDSVRMIAGSGLGSIKYVKALKVLNQVANNPMEEEHVRNACIDSIRVLQGTPLLQIIRERIDAERKTRIERTNTQEVLK